MEESPGPLEREDAWFPSVVESRQKTGKARQTVETTVKGGSVVTCGGMTEITHRWAMLPQGLTWRSDAHVLLAVHHKTSHRLPVGVIGCALTYWKSVEHCFLATAKRVISWCQDTTCLSMDSVRQL